MKREPILNLPGVLTALIATLVVVHLALHSVSGETGLLWLEYFAFVPAKLSLLVAPTATLRALAEYDADDLTQLVETSRFVWVTPLSYAFLHANWTHLGVNAVTLAAFGAPVARRLGDTRFLAFFAVTALGGAAAHYAVHPFDPGPVVGASASISGMIAAIARFAFTPGGALSDSSGRPGAAARPTLVELASDRRAVIFLVSWIAANLIFGVLAPPAGEVGSIAWEAHMGGFLTGLTLFRWFDPTGRNASRRG